MSDRATLNPVSGEEKRCDHGIAAHGKSGDRILERAPDLHSVQSGFAPGFAFAIDGGLSA